MFNFFKRKDYTSKIGKLCGSDETHPIKCHIKSDTENKDDISIKKSVYVIRVSKHKGSWYAQYDKLEDAIADFIRIKADLFTSNINMFMPNPHTSGEIFIGSLVDIQSVALQIKTIAYTSDVIINFEFKNISCSESFPEFKKGDTSCMKSEN